MVIPIGQSGHYLLSWFISPDEFLSNEHQTTLDSMKNYYWNRTERPPHPSVRNYWNMMAKKRFYTLHVVDEVELCTGVKTAILKTFWLRIFQRKWRNICKDKQLARRKMKDIIISSRSRKMAGIIIYVFDAVFPVYFYDVFLAYAFSRFFMSFCPSSATTATFGGLGGPSSATPTASSTAAAYGLPGATAASPHVLRHCLTTTIATSATSAGC